MKIFRVLVAVSVLTLGLAGGSAPVGAASCGDWRWPVKTLSDKARRQVHFSPITTTVKRFRTRRRPNVTFRTNTPRTGFVEFHTWKMHAHPIKATYEPDSDIHLVISVPHAPHKTMIVEFPNPTCVKAPFKRRKIGAARKHFLANCGSISGLSWTRLKGAIVIMGVGFWDEKHGQTGIAPNGVELHPVLSFKGICSKR